METLRALHPDELVGEVVAVKSLQEEREAEVEERVVALLDVAVVVDGVSKKGHCQVCNGWDDEHSATCPVPALEMWLAARYN